MSPLQDHSQPAKHLKTIGFSNMQMLPDTINILSTCEETPIIPLEHCYNLKHQAFHEEAIKASLLGAAIEQIFGLDQHGSTKRRAYKEWRSQSKLYGLEERWILPLVEHRDNSHCKGKASIMVLLCHCNMSFIFLLQTQS